MTTQHTILLLSVYSSLQLLAAVALGDDEASNRIYVQSSTYGSYYAKCIPDELYGTKGRTLLYQVRKGEDDLIHTFEWYSARVYLQHTAWGPSVIRLGPWHRGRTPSAEDLALALYRNGKLLIAYSTKDIATLGGVSESVSHYTVFQKIHGYRWIDSNDYAFDVQLHNGRTISFDVNTGEIIKGTEQPAGAVTQEPAQSAAP